MTTDIVLHHAFTKSDFNKTIEDIVYIQQGASTQKDNPLPEILFMSSFPPRECGIATYSQDLVQSLKAQFDHSFTVSICALESNSERHQYETKPAYILNTDERNAFDKMAFQISKAEQIKLVVIQHEFGFFASRENEFIWMCERIKQPLVFVFHTVLPNPNPAMYANVHAMAGLASAIVVMTKDAASILTNDYHVPPSKITVIPHGTHLVPPVDREKIKSKYQLPDKKVLSTFGLLGSSKSIETTLNALPDIIEKHPDVMFLILGKTHPTIVKQDGEVYRNSLEAIVKTLNLEEHVRFVNEYIQLPILLEYLQLTDVYLFTSKDPNQAVSGTFSYAVSSGCPVVSTPIPHAKEVLSHNNGLIIDFESSEQLAKAVIFLLDHEKLRNEITLQGFHQMAATAWQNSAIAHALLFEKWVSSIQLNFSVPQINMDHVHRMTTNFGMIQFATCAIPDIHSGYTLDDNARALVAVCQHYELFEDEEDLALITIYLQFIKHCFQPNSKFLNYMNEYRNFTPQNHNENLDDSTGRAIWALGYVSSLHGVLPIGLTTMADNLLNRAVPHLVHIHSTRAMAFIIKGLHYQHKNENSLLLEQLANRLIQMYRHEKDANWSWFEGYMTYGNSVLSEALLCAYLSTENDLYKIIAKESFDFLLSKVFVEGKIRVISNQGWLIKNENPKTTPGGEQPIDVAYTILALERFKNVFQDGHYEDKITLAFNWFLGSNHLHQIIYNPCTGGCYDGLEEHNINFNQGAESTLSYFMARLVIERLYANNMSPEYKHSIGTNV